jgi:hypothetical protein
MSPYRQKLEYQRQIAVLNRKITRINDQAERDQAARLLRFLGKSGATFSVGDANAHSISGSVDWPDQHGTLGIAVEKQVRKLLDWDGYHQRFHSTLPSRDLKRPHYFSFSVDDSSWGFQISFHRPQAGKLDRQLTDEEKNDTFFVRYLSRFCKSHGLKIDFWRFERDAADAKKRADEKQANVERLRAAL